MFVSRVGVVGDSALAEAIAKAGFAVVHRDHPASDYAGFGDVDIVIVAAAEDEQDVFAALDAATPGHAILASARASGSVTELGDVTSRPGQVVGFVAEGRLVQIVESAETSEETAQAAANFAQALRRQPVRCGEAPGLIVDRVRNAEDALAEACAVLEEGIAGVRDIDLAMMLGAGMKPGPFAAADQRGLDALDDPPRTVRRLVAQGRLGVQAGQGFYPYPRPDAGYEEAAVKLETRGEIAIAWLDNPPANSLSPDVLAAMRTAWDAARDARVFIVASANPALFCAGADIKAFTKMDEAAGRAMLDAAHGLLLDFEASRVVTIAAVNGLAFGGGCELAMACDVRLAGFSATFGQPEVNLGIIPGFGGTQRLPRLAGEAKALEMNLTGDAISADDAYEHGLVNDVVADHELFDTALNWARKLAGQAPVAVEQIKRASGQGIDAEKDGFMTAFGSEDATEGIGAFLGKREPRWQGR